MRIGNLERLLEVIENEMSDRIRKLAKRKIIENNLLTKDELETLHAAYNDMKKENLTLKNENERLNKSNYKMRGKNQKQGAKVLRLENELRRTDSVKWDNYKKEMK